MEIKKVALIGAGAIGCVYAYSLNKLLKDDFAFIANGKRREKLEKEGLYKVDPLSRTLEKKCG